MLGLSVSSSNVLLQLTVSIFSRREEVKCHVHENNFHCENKAP